ncbi:MAG: YheT family hydrolase, partial [Saprospiraceae bacterium]
MPYIKNSNYYPAWYLPNGHFETIYPSVFRKNEILNWSRERLELSDGDFLDLDWLRQDKKQLVILTHGLEGSSRRPYCEGMALKMYAEGWDILAWNCRSCSGEMNRSAKLYSHADIDDIAAVIEHADSQFQYNSVVLIGFSMGGAISLNYLGRHEKVSQSITAAIGFSMPTHLKTSVLKLEERGNRIYKKRFLRQLSEKIRIKAQQYPDLLNASNLDKIQLWTDFDEWYSAPMNGLTNAEEFYQKASAINVLEQIKVPFLICNAQNDPLLGPLCSPIEMANKQDNFWLETPRYGGHVGFFPLRDSS